MFGSSSQSIFGGQQAQNPTAFGAAATQQQFGSSGIFSNQLQQNAGSIFTSTQQANLPFVNTPSNQQEMGFGVQQPVVSQFAPQQQPSAFPSQPTSVFANADSSVFSQSSAPIVDNRVGSSNIFNAQMNTGSNAHTSSIFGNQNAWNSGPAIPQQIVDDTAYSKLEDLSENEMKVFASESFEFGQIPEKPPTLEMCF